MRDRMEKFASFPFSVGCVSHSSVDVVEKQPKKSQVESNPAPTSKPILSSLCFSHIQGCVHLIHSVFFVWRHNQIQQWEAEELIPSSPEAQRLHWDSEGDQELQELIPPVPILQRGGWWRGDRDGDWTPYWCPACGSYGMGWIQQWEHWHEELEQMPGAPLSPRNIPMAVWACHGCPSWSSPLRCAQFAWRRRFGTINIAFLSCSFSLLPLFFLSVFLVRSACEFV